MVSDALGPKYMVEFDVNDLVEIEKDGLMLHNITSSSYFDHPGIVGGIGVIAG